MPSYLVHALDYVPLAVACSALFYALTMRRHLRKMGLDSREHAERTEEAARDIQEAVTKLEKLQKVRRNAPLN